MNVELLRKVQKHIAEEPKRWCFLWVDQGDSWCDTRACIGGWTCILSNEEWTREPRLAMEAKNREGFNFKTTARMLLELTPLQAERLFLDWPQKFWSREWNAYAAVARIEHFIQTEGRE